MSLSPRRLKILSGASSVVHAHGDADPFVGIRRAVELARKAEAERFTGLFTSDLLQADRQGVFGLQGTQDPLIVLAALSQATTHIGLIATVSTTYTHPFNLARAIGTLDHVSGGRAAWNAVTSSVGEENFGGGDIPTPEERYARATEFIEVVNALFDANDKQAVTRKPSGAIAADPSRFHPIHYRGAHFAVEGPLNVPPPPQGRPVQFQAGQSAEGVKLGARLAEAVYTSQPTLEQAIAFAGELRRQARTFGRDEGLPLIMNSLHSVIGESEADVARRVREKHERIDYDKGRLQLADMLGGNIDLFGLPLDAPLPENLLPGIEESRRRRGRIEIFRAYALKGLTLRELIIQAGETGHWAVAGTPEQLADAVEERYRAGVLDVLTLHGLGNPEQEDLLVNGLLPELRKRRLLDEDYVEGGFRANLGLPPVVRATPAIVSAAE